jgi:4-hydroxyphenylpyruvate dioxygenase
METTQEIGSQVKANGKSQDFLPLKRIDHVEFFVGNAKQSALFAQHVLGFRLTAYAGLETKLKDRVSYVLEQGKIRFVFTGSLTHDNEIAEHHRKHGDGVKDIAIEVDDAESAYNETTKRGAEGILEPVKYEDENGYIIRSSIKTYGDTIHSFIERKNYNGVFFPGFIEAGERAFNDVKDVNLRAIDHMVGNVELGKMNEWVKFYAHSMGFNQLISFDDKDISTDYTALMSKVMQNGTGKIKFPINEPAGGKKKSQIEEYIDFYKGAGVQHIAMSTPDILATVTELRKRGIEFLNIPTTYYTDLIGRVGKIDENVEDLEKLGILVDRDEDGYLLQIFTKPIVDRPTLFFEIIQRKGARSFGKGNFKALFEAIEREQALRGTLERE